LGAAEQQIKYLLAAQARRRRLAKDLDPQRSCFLLQMIGL
jgi:hypothetical protein